MAWDSRGYYYRGKKVSGEVRREYVGRGPAAQACAELDRLEREGRQADREAQDAERAALEALDEPMNELNDLADLVARAALLAAGYHQHHRGEWRKRRGKHDEGC
jgi:hypothetical protein